MQQFRYIATSVGSATQLGYESVSVFENKNGRRIESRTVAYNCATPEQRLQFLVDDDWSPLQVILEVGSDFSFSCIFDDAACTMCSIIRGDKEQRVVELARRTAFVLLNGIFYLPLHLIRRFDFHSSGVQRFSIPPVGVCEIARVHGAPSLGDNRKMRLEARFFLCGSEETLDIVADSKLNLLEYTARQANCRIALE